MERPPWPIAALVAVMLSVCFLAAATSAADDMTGDWKLVKIGEKEVLKTVVATLSVTAVGKVSGDTGVNRFSGQLAKDKTLFGPLATTRRAGPPDAMEVEAGFTKALSEVTRFAIKDKTLTLFAGDTPRLILEKVERPN